MEEFVRTRLLWVKLNLDEIITETLLNMSECSERVT